MGHPLSLSRALAGSPSRPFSLPIHLGVVTEVVDIENVYVMPHGADAAIGPLHCFYALPAVNDVVSLFKLPGGQWVAYNGWASAGGGGVCFTVPTSSNVAARAMFTMSDGAQVVFFEAEADPNSLWGYSIRRPGEPEFDDPIVFFSDGSMVLTGLVNGAASFKRSGDRVFAVAILAGGTGVFQQVMRFDYAGGAITVVTGAPAVSTVQGSVAEFYLDDANGLVHLWSFKRSGDGGGSPWVWSCHLQAADWNSLDPVYALSGPSIAPYNPDRGFGTSGNENVNATTAIAGDGATFFLVSVQLGHYDLGGAVTDYRFDTLAASLRVRRIVATGGGYTVTTESGFPSSPFVGTQPLIQGVGYLRAAWDGDLIIFVPPTWAAGEDHAEVYAVERSGANTYSEYVAAYEDVAVIGSASPENTVQASGQVDLLWQAAAGPQRSSRVGGTWDPTPALVDPSSEVESVVLDPTDENSPDESWYAYSRWNGGDPGAFEVCTAKLPPIVITPPSSMIQVSSIISGDRCDSWRLISDRTYSLTNIADGDIVLVADIWEASIAFVMPDELWASDSSFQYHSLYGVHEGRIGFRLFWHKYSTGDNNGAMSVFTGGGEALWDDPASWPDPFNEFMFIRRGVWRIRGAHPTAPFTGVQHVYDVDGNSGLALPSHVATLGQAVIAMGCFTSASAPTLLGSVNAGPSPGFTNISNNGRGSSAPGMGLSMNHSIGSPFAGTVSRSFTASGSLATALSAIFGARGA